MEHPVGDTPEAIHLKDYSPPDYHVQSVELRFELAPEATLVTSRLQVEADYDWAAGVRPLVLNGQELELLALRLDGAPLAESDYARDATSLTVHTPPGAFTLEVVTRINPKGNTALEGLYLSGGIFCTQCEAEGFRKITYFPDRPDVMSVFTTTVVADQADAPVLLSNGNRIETGELEDGRHFATWHDPFPKPCYLFALVAGDLACIEDTFTTVSGREVALRIYVREHDLDKCDHAMRSLKKAMRWDEERYGREYDLDIYMIVAVNDFNMGAMENKGLNIFNSRFVLARPDTATDSDFVGIESVVAHEYFHNWSGNRVTCRDWFQLSLKEGFTVFRDSQFSAEMTSSAIKRIDDVTLLRTRQFAEDAGPMAHPVRPDSYVEINNFYTLTVYEKGAEVVRMLHTLLGPERFRRGTDLYFERHDGQAVTTDDFVRALEEANGLDLTQFRRWYGQAGTPVVSVEAEHDAAAARYRLTLRQHTPPTPGQHDKLPLHIPVAMGLLGAGGAPLPLRLEGEAEAVGDERVLELTGAEQSFTFLDVPEPPVPSLLRGFSAPVKLALELDDAQLAFLMAHDSDPFNRWDAGQRLALRVMLRLLEGRDADVAPQLDAGLSQAFAATLADRTLDHALVAEALTLPSEAYVAECVEVVDPIAIHEVRTFLRRALAEAHHDALWAAYRGDAETGAYRLDVEAMGRRRLKNLALAYLMELDEAEAAEACIAQFEQGTNMTDALAALTALVHTQAPGHEAALAGFYARWREEPLVVDKWFSVQATSPRPGALARLCALTEHPDFTLTNPNRVRAVVGAFCMRNSAGFHEGEGDGYRFLADTVMELDLLNPQVAARLLDPLTRWRRYDSSRQESMRAELERILESASLSRDVYEVVSKSLEG